MTNLRPLALIGLRWMGLAERRARPPKRSGSVVPACRDSNGAAAARAAKATARVEYMLMVVVVFWESPSWRCDVLLLKIVGLMRLNSKILGGWYRDLICVRLPNKLG